MSQPVQDHFWTETAAAIRDAIGADARLIAPREMRLLLPKVFSYDWVYAIDVLDDYAGVAVHKGLIHELPLAVLQTLNGEWKCVFANPVFLFFVPGNSSLPAVTGHHLPPFYEGIRTLEKLAAANRPPARETTAFLVLASHSAEGLDNTLGSLLLAAFHSPVMVAAVGSDAARLESYRAICSRHNVRCEEGDTSIAGAMKAGVRRLLKMDGIDWISTFDDTHIARPDFLPMMEKFRHRDTSPVLSGFWNGKDTVLQSFQCDGTDLLLSRLRDNDFILHAHRKYWEELLGIASHGIRKDPEVLVIPNLIFKSSIMQRLDHPTSHCPASAAASGLRFSSVWCAITKA